MYNGLLKYINKYHFFRKCNAIPFADDTNLFATRYNINDIVSEVNKYITNIYAWV